MTLHYVLYTIAGVMILLGLFLLFKRFFHSKNTHAVSLESPVHIDPISAQPIIPRHVRDQLGIISSPKTQSTDTSSISETPHNTTNTTENTAVEPATLAATQPIQEDTTSVHPTENSKTTAAEPSILNINPQIEVQPVAAFVGESELLNANLEVQQRHEQHYQQEETQTIEFYMYLNEHKDALMGERFLNVIKPHGLVFGEMNYFHRYLLDNHNNLHHMFSLANRGVDGKVEPFDLNSLPNETIYSVVFFISFPHHSALKGFDMMMSTMHRIARELRGRIYDSQRNELTPQMEEQLRLAIKEYMEYQAKK